MTGKKAVKEEVVEIAAVKEMKRTIERRETETIEIETAETEGIGEIAEMAEMIEEAGMKEIAGIAKESPGNVKMQKENQRVVADREIAAQGA